LHRTFFASTVYLCTYLFYMAYRKWVGTVIGGLTGGVIGAIIGFAIGSVADGLTGKVLRPGQGPYDEFSMSLLVLAAAVMKADGKIMRSELHFVRNFLQQQFGNDKASKLIVVFKNVLQQEIPLEKVCLQIKSFMNYGGRLQLLHFLWGIAGADGEFHPSETRIITRIAYLLGVNRPDQESIKAMFIGNEDAAYKILEVSPNATDDEVKKAFRRMAAKYHPDKVEHLGDDVKNAATEKFKELNKAYETVKKMRGMA
jgi:DnaJ like chaperone protein